MQTPSASDPSFKAFLDKLKEQNGGGILAQKETTKGIDKTNESLDELKDETSSVRDSLREGLHDVSDDIIEVQDQLDTANDSLSEIATAIIGSKESFEVEMLTALSDIKEAVTGVKLDIDLSELKAAIENVGTDVGKDIDGGHLVATIGAIGANTTKLQDEQLKEISLVRKLTEGSVEYDKEAAQYRNKSGRDVESKVSGKTSKDGGFIDFETARDTLSGQGERARKENKVKLITGVTTTRPGKATAEALGADLGSSAPVNVAEPVAKTPEVVPSESTEKASEVAPSRNTSIKRARRERSSVTGNVAPKEEKDEKLDTSFLGRVKDSAKFWLTDGLSEKPGTGAFQKPSKEVEKKDREAKVSSPSEKNPDVDNTKSSNEEQVKVEQSDLELSRQMLDTTKAQLIELKAIREALAPSTPKELTEQKSAPSSTSEKEAGESGGSSLIGDLAGAAGDLLGKGGKGKAAGKAAGMGGKILGGLGKAAKFLGPAAAIAGAAYSGFEGYQNTNENFDLKEGEEATTGQKISSTLGGVASGATFGLLDEKTASQGIHKAGSAVKDFFGFGDKKAPETVSPSTTTTTSTTSESKTRIAGEDVGEKLSDRQMAVIGMSKASGNKYSPEVEAMYSKQKEAAVTPSTAPTPGATVAQTSTENADMTREASAKGGANNTVVSNNVSSNNTTKIVPMKASPRPEYTGSSLDRYTSRITVY